MKHTGFLAYFGSEIVFWIVVASVGGAISCAVDQQYALSYIFGGVAAFFAFILLYRAGERSRRGPGLFYCERCQLYYSPERAEGEKGAI
jgi:cytochrome c biogenesis protein CcdA